jgi:uncharacterized protein
MPDYLSPGVYIEEVSGAQPIEGVSTSVTGFVGVTQRGPADTLGPVLVTSFPEFVNTFGSYFVPSFSTTTPSFLPHAVAGFFNNGGQLLYIKRVYSLTPGTGPTPATPAVAPSPTALENNRVAPPPLALKTRLLQTAMPGTMTLQLASMRAIQNGTTLTLNQTKNGITTASPTLTVEGYNDATSTVTLAAALPAPTPPATAYEAQYTMVVLTGNTGTNEGGNPLAPAPNTANFGIQAMDPGAWGDNINLQITPSSRTQAQVLAIGSVAPGTNNQLLLNSAANFYVGAIIEINTGGSFTVAGTATGVFVAEQVTQAATGATATILGGAVPPAGPMTIGPITGGIPDASSWKGLTSGATFNATAAPAPVIGGKFYAKVTAINGNSLTLNGPLVAVTAVADITANLGATPQVPTVVRTCEFDITASYGTVNESFRGLTLDNTTPYYYATTLVNGSSLLSVPTPYPSDQTTADPSTMPVAAVDGLTVALAGGSDGAAVTPIDYVGADYGPGNRTGIQALIDQADISIIAAPGATDQTTQQALITQCENLMYRFAILDPAPTSTGGTPKMADIQSQRSQYDTKYAAIYYPRLVLTDPLTDMPLTIPPSGHVAGIYVQTDNSRGVWKAPANVVINGITSLEIKLSKGDQDILNPEPNNINALRDFTAQDRGLRVYGARCITSLTEWKYVNVRRLFIFLEASLDEGLQWAVFEPNDQRLWNQLIQSISAFLTTIWRQGGLMGAKAEEAFFVKCGNDTMTQDDIDNGRLILLVGVAPVFPAEFVIVRIGQWAGGSSVQEL